MSCILDVCLFPQKSIHIVENVSILRAGHVALEALAQGVTDEKFIASNRRITTLLCHAYNAAMDWFNAMQPSEELKEELERATEEVHDIARNMVKWQLSKPRFIRLPNIKYLVTVLPDMGRRITHHICGDNCSMPPTKLACHYH